jgi:hypothetical protein
MQDNEEKTQAYASVRQWNFYLLQSAAAVRLGASFQPALPTPFRICTAKTYRSAISRYLLSNGFISDTGADGGQRAHLLNLRARLLT